MSEQAVEVPAAEASATPVEADGVAAQPRTIDVNNMSGADRAAVLRSVHNFLSSYDRVPGALALQWGNCLDALGLVINSLVVEEQKKAQEALSKK